MSFTNRNLPAFGVSRSRRNASSEQQSFINNFDLENTVIVPIFDLQNHIQNGFKVGELVINQQDSLLYYYTGRQWVPLAVMDPQNTQSIELINQLISLQDNSIIIEAPDTGNIQLVAGDNLLGTGGNITICAGHGGFSDGEIYLDIGGEHALTINQSANVIINEGNIQMESGDIVIKNGNIELENPVSGIICNIARAEVTATSIKNSQRRTLLDSDDTCESDDSDNFEDECKIDTIPDAILNGMSGILTVNLELKNGEMIYGQIRNGLLQENSWVGLTIVNNGSGIPYAWLDAPQDGMIRYHVKCLDGELSRVQLHFDVRNSV